MTLKCYNENVMSLFLAHYCDGKICTTLHPSTSPGVGVASEVGVVLRGGMAGGGCGVTSGISYVASVAGCGPLVLPLPITSYS